MTNLQQRLLTAMALLPWVLLAIFVLPGGLFALLMMGVLIILALEWFGLMQPPINAFTQTLTLGLMVTLGFVLSTGLIGHIFWLWWVAGLLAIAIYLVIQFARQGDLTWGKQNWFMLVFGFSLLTTYGVAMVQVRETFGLAWFLYGLSLVWVADTGAYFAGSKFGRHKLAPLVSPGKTWEGVLGALLLVSLYALIFHPYLEGVSLFYLWYFSWLLVIISVFGDLLESLYKRLAGKKDSSNLLPGHGGLLDRLDATLLSMPFLWFILLWGLPAS